MPTPTPITGGALIDMVGADVYPLPPETVVSPVTTPLEIFAVNDPTIGKGVLEIILILNSGELSAS